MTLSLDLRKYSFYIVRRIDYLIERCVMLSTEWAISADMVSFRER